MPSFDIVSEVDKQEIDNAINQARKELATRFDFKGSVAEIEDRFAANPALARLNEYGGSFFDLAAGRAAGILLFFAGCFLGLAWLLLRRSRA